MRSIPLALLFLASLLASSAASAQARSGAAPCSHRRMDFIEACLGHVLVRGDEGDEIRVDGAVVGHAPMLISIDTDSAHTFEVRPARGAPRRHTMLLTKGRLATLALHRGHGRSLRGLTWARFASFDRCDGYATSGEPHALPMSAAAFARFRRGR